MTRPSGDRLAHVTAGAGLERRARLLAGSRFQSPHLVAVCLGRADVVLGALGDGAPQVRRNLQGHACPGMAWCSAPTCSGKVYRTWVRHEAKTYEPHVEPHTAIHAGHQQTANATGIGDSEPRWGPPVQGGSNMQPYHCNTYTACWPLGQYPPAAPRSTPWRPQADCREPPTQHVAP